MGAIPSGSMSWSARYLPTGTPAARYSSAWRRASLATSSARTPNWPKAVKTSVTCSASSSIITALPGPREPFTSSIMNEASSQPAFLRDGPALPLGDVPRQVGHDGADPPGDDRAAIEQFQAAELLRRLDADRELPAAGRIETRPDKPQLDPRPQPVYQGQIRLFQEIHRRGHGIVRAALQDEVRLAFGQQERGQHGLEHQGRAAGRADAEGIVARPNRAGAEHQTPGAQGRPFHFGAADLGCGQDGRQVLLQQARLLPAGTDLLDYEGPARHQGKRQRRAEHLPAALALGTIDRQESLSHRPCLCP